MTLGLDFHSRWPAAAEADLAAQVKGASPYAAEILAFEGCFEKA
jgi:hypothetical protein